MSDFKVAFRITIFGNEGGFNPGVGEAETIYGIDRSMNPKWQGWPSFDILKKGRTVKQVNIAVKNNIQMQAAIMDFYLRNYWNPLLLSEIKSQQVANTLFDCSVNPCIDTAAEVAQKACNVVKPGSLIVDGNIGEKSIGVINKLSENLLFTAINGIRSANYHHRVALTPKMKIWLPVWLKRLLPSDENLA